MRSINPKGTTVSETTTAPVAAAKAAKAAKDVASNVPHFTPEELKDIAEIAARELSQETADLALTVPTKVILSQPLIVVAAILGGAGLGAGVLYGVQKLRARKETKDLEEKLAQAEQHDNA